MPETDALLSAVAAHVFDSEADLATFHTLPTDIKSAVLQNRVETHNAAVAAATASASDGGDAGAAGPSSYSADAIRAGNTPQGRSRRRRSKKLSLQKLLARELQSQFYLVRAALLSDMQVCVCLPFCVCER